jgi:hypothetical protein
VLSPPELELLELELLELVCPLLELDLLCPLVELELLELELLCPLVELELLELELLSPLVELELLELEPVPPLLELELVLSDPGHGTPPSYGVGAPASLSRVQLVAKRSGTLTGADDSSGPHSPPDLNGVARP